MHHILPAGLLLWDSLGQVPWHWWKHRGQAESHGLSVPGLGPGPPASSHISKQEAQVAAEGERNKTPKCYQDQVGSRLD